MRDLKCYTQLSDIIYVMPGQKQYDFIFKFHGRVALYQNIQKQNCCLKNIISYRINQNIIQSISKVHESKNKHEK